MMKIQEPEAPIKAKTVAESIAAQNVIQSDNPTIDYIVKTQAEANKSPYAKRKGENA